MLFFGVQQILTKAFLKRFLRHKNTCCRIGFQTDTGV